MKLELKTLPSTRGQNYNINIQYQEFTCLSDKDRPQFANIIIDYVPNEKVIERISLDKYMQQYRNEKMYMEQVTNTILKDMVAMTSPRAMVVTVIVNAGSGSVMKLQARYEEPKSGLAIPLHAMQTVKG